MLLEPGAGVGSATAQQNTPLQEAARFGHAEVVHLLLESGANVNAVNARRETALQRAVLYDWTYAVKELLLWHADVNMRDVDGDTALIAALFATEADLLEVLLETNRANLNVLNNAGKTLLMIALRRCDPGRFLTPLLEAGADVAQVVDDDGVTVL